MNDPIMLARLAILPLSLIPIGMTFWYMRCLTLLPQKSPKRVGALLVFVLGGLLVLVVQKDIYAKIAATQAMKDAVVQLTIIAQGLISIGIIFYVLLKDRDLPVDFRAT